MTTVVVTVLLLVSLVGHVILWIGLVNRLHATALARGWMRLVTAVLYGILLVIPLLFLVHWVRGGLPLGDYLQQTPGRRLPFPVDLWRLYLLLAIAIAVLRGPVWVIDRARHRPPAVVVKHHTESVDLTAVLGRYPVAGWPAELLSRLPGNQMFRLDVDEEEVEFARIPPALVGLSILHLTDFHFSRRVTRDYFDEVVRIANRLQPDLLAVTGDVCDAADRIDWVGPIFGELVAPLGKYFVLGNHDKRVKDVARLRAALSAAGCVDLAAGPRLTRTVVIRSACSLVMRPSAAAWTTSWNAWTRSSRVWIFGSCRLMGFSGSRAKILSTQKLRAHEYCPFLLPQSTCE